MITGSSEQGIVFVVCGPSGVGKTTLCEALLEKCANLELSVSYTTRDPRPDETDGEDYHFVDREAFKKMRAEAAFLEWARVHGEFYGTPITSVREPLSQGKDILFDIDIQGARQIRQQVNDAHLVMIAPPDMETLKHRLSERGAESEDSILRRLEAARDELTYYPMFNSVVENDDFEDAIDALRSVYIASRHTAQRQSGRIEEMLTEEYEQI